MKRRSMIDILSTVFWRLARTTPELVEEFPVQLPAVGVAEHGFRVEVALRLRSA